MLDKIMVFVLALFISMSVYATSRLNEKGSQFIISPSIGYYKYKNATPGLMKITGPSLSFGVDYQYAKQNDIVFMVNSDFGFVNGSYTGNLFDNKAQTFDNDNSIILQISPRLGYQFFFQEQTLKLLPSIGLGYRYLNNYASNEPGDYLRQSTYFYIISSLRFEYTYKYWTWKANIEFNTLMYGAQYSRTRGGVKNKQDNGFGINGYILMGSGTSFIGPYIKYWSIGDSDRDISGLSESKNSTLEVGVMYQFVF